MSKTTGDNPLAFFGLNATAGNNEILRAYQSLLKKTEESNLPEHEKRVVIKKVNDAYQAVENLQSVGGLQVELLNSRTNLAVLDEPQLVYTLISMGVADKNYRPEKCRKVICFLVDRSTSMQGEHIQMVRANIERAIESLEESDEIAIVTFSDRAEIMVPILPIREARKGLFWNLIKTGGSTEIYYGLKTGLDLLKTADSRNTTRHLLLLTDGKTYGDENDCLEISKEAWEHQIPITAFGIGPDWNDRLLDQIASNSGGQTEFISTNDDLKNCLDQKIKMIADVLIKGLALDYQIADDVRLLDAHLIGNQSLQLPIEGALHLGALHYEEKLQVLLEFLVDPRLEPADLFEIFTGELTATDTGEIPLKKQFLSVRLPIIQGSIPEYPNPRIISALSTVMLYRLQDKARKEIESKRTNDGTRHLQYLATHMLSRGEHQLAHDILHQVRNIRQNEPIDGTIDKRIKYGTRALITALPDNGSQT